MWVVRKFSYEMDGTFSETLARAPRRFTFHSIPVVEQPMPGEGRYAVKGQQKAEEDRPKHDIKNEQSESECCCGELLTACESLMDCLRCLGECLSICDCDN